MPPPCESRTISRSRRRTRLRSTALPTCRDTVKPMRTGPSSARRRACTTKAPTDARKPLAAARKSVRCLNRSMVVAEDMAADEMRSRTEPLAALRAPGRQHPAAALGRHAGAKAVTAFAHQFARLVGPFHGIDLRARPVHRKRSGVNLIGAQLARLIRKPSRPVNVTGRAARAPA